MSTLSTVIKALWIIRSGSPEDGNAGGADVGAVAEKHLMSGAKLWRKSRMWLFAI